MSAKSQITLDKLVAHMRVLFPQLTRYEQEVGTPATSDEYKALFLREVDIIKEYDVTEDMLEASFLLLKWVASRQTDKEWQPPMITIDIDNPPQP